MHRYTREIVVFLVLRARSTPSVFTTCRSYGPEPSPLRSRTESVTDPFNSFVTASLVLTALVSAYYVYDRAYCFQVVSAPHLTTNPGGLFVQVAYTVA